MNTKKLYGFKVDVGLLHKVPITFVGPMGLTDKQYQTFLAKIIKDWIKPVIKRQQEK